MRARKGLLTHTCPESFKAWSQRDSRRIAQGPLCFCSLVCAALVVVPPCAVFAALCGYPLHVSVWVLFVRLFLSRRFDADSCEFLVGTGVNAQTPSPTISLEV